MANSMKKAISLILAALLCLLLVSCGGGELSDYERGLKFLSEGNYEEAIIAFTAAIEIDPKLADNYLARAAAYAASGQSELAAADITAAEELDPTGDGPEGIYDEDGKPLVEVVYYPDGSYDIFFCSYVDGEKHGTETIYYEDGSYDIYFYKYNEQGALVKTYCENHYSDGTLQICEDYDSTGLWCNKTTIINADGRVMEYHIFEYEGENYTCTSYYSDGRIFGKHISNLYNNETLYEEYYEYWTDWSESGPLMYAHYLDHVTRTGRVEWYDEAGNLTQTESFYPD